MICKIGSVVAVEIMGTMKSIILTKNFLRTIILTKDILTTIILTTIILTKLKKINFRSGGFLAVPDVPGAADVIAAQEAIIRSHQGVGVPALPGFEVEIIVLVIIMIFSNG